MASRTKVHYVVQCTKHGSESTLWAGKQVKVSKPRNKRDRNHGGCPSCKAERNAAAAS
jgi:hypothetical protein